MYYKTIKELILILYIFIRDFSGAIFDKKLGYYSASLSFYTISSIIPLLIVIFYIFNNLPIFEDVHIQIREFIIHNFLPTNYNETMKYVDKFLISSDKKLGILELSYIILATTLFFRNYDIVINEIFGTKKRNLLRVAKTYWIFLIAVSLIIPLSFYLSILIDNALTNNTSQVTVHIFYFLPYFIIWGLFFISYKVSASIRIRTKAAFISSFISSGIWYVSKIGFTFYILNNSKMYLSIYGSLSILLIFMLWLYLSWAIYLRGLKLCCMLNRNKNIDGVWCGY